MGLSNAERQRLYIQRLKTAATSPIIRDTRERETYYHYTNRRGLHGIIKNKEIWASDYRRLNDTSEFRHGQDVFEKVYLGTKRNLSSDAIKIIDEGMSAITHPDYQVFIASFCAEGDLLSQWRGYNGGEGYAIGIDAEWMNYNADEQNFRLHPVEYRLDDQHTVVVAKFELLRKLLEEAGASQEKRAENLRKWWEYAAVPVMLALKSYHFKEEFERRLVLRSVGLPPNALARKSNREPINYVPFKLEKANIRPAGIGLRGADVPNLGIKLIRIGPALDEESERSELKDFLESTDLERPDLVKIDKSAIPYATPH